MKKLLMLVVGIWSAAVLAAPVTAKGTGRHTDYRAAVYDALAQAMSQVEGLSLQESRESLMKAFGQSQESSVSGDVAISDIREALQQSVAVKTEGRILSYEILAEYYESDTKTWRVQVEAKMPGRYVVGRDPDNLRRMVVMPFRSLTAKVKMMGEEVDCAKGNEEIADSLNTFLTHTRKFTMLDRQFNNETMAELSRLNMSNASAGDLGRFGQLLVTDYMVVGTVKFYPQLDPVSNPYVVGGTTVRDSTCVEVSYRVLLVPTSQLKWADTVKIPYSYCSGSSAEEVMASAVECAAEEICEQIISNIYPLRITGKTTFELVVNQGGRNVQVGDVFDVFRRGEMMVDVTTNEALGYSEEQIARIRIVRTTPKMSYAIVVEGTPVEDIEVGAFVRRPSAYDGSYAQPQNAVRPIQVAPGGGVTPPWAQ